jgi:hypothetical protein
MHNGVYCQFPMLKYYKELRMKGTSYKQQKKEG